MEVKQLNALETAANLEDCESDESSDMEANWQPEAEADSSNNTVEEYLSDSSSDSDGDSYAEPDMHGDIEWMGGMYTGSLLQGIPQGQGMLIRSGQTVYSGHFRNGRFHGLGIFTRPDGSTLQCWWRDGKPSWLSSIDSCTIKDKIFTAAGLLCLILLCSLVWYTVSVRNTQNKNFVDFISKNIS